MKQTFVVAGGGMAAAVAVQTLREEGFDGRVLLIADEPVRPYDRVPLSKQYVRGEPGGHKLFVHDEAYYRDHEIELTLATSVAAVDVGARHITLASDERVGYDALLLATGAEVRRLQVPGADLDGVHYLRTLTDAERLRTAIGSARRLVVIGAGWIGCEVAASARQMGTDVALVDVDQLPLASALGLEAARFYRDLHADHGVELRLGTQVSALRGAGRVEQVVLADGDTLAADTVVVGIGVRPRVRLAERAGLAIHNGIVTDERLATSVPGVFAAGDVANVWHPALGRRLRLEHWSAALSQGPVAARNMMGRPTTYNRVPFFFSDQYDVWMEYSGDATDHDQVVLRGQPADGAFIVFWLRGGRLLAGMNVNIRNVADTIARLVAAGSTLDPAALADPGTDLASLLRTDGIRKQQ